MTTLETLIKLDHESRQFGFDWPNQDAILDQVIDECREIREDIQGCAAPHKIQEEIGDLLHAAISLCIFSGFDVNDTLAKVNIKFERRMTLLKKLAKERGLKNLDGKTTEFILGLWSEIKVMETTQIKNRADQLS